MRLAYLPILAGAVFIGCGQTSQNTQGAATLTPQEPDYVVETFAEGLEVPWAIDFAPDGRIFVTERPGRLRVIIDGKLREEPVHTFPDVRHQGEIGLMGMCLHPDFARNRWIYLAYGYGRYAVRVVRYREEGNRLMDRTVIIEDLPAGANHAGCRIKFGPDRKLYITTGDATRRQIAQDLNSLGGKTLRLNDDGSVPPDNPFVGQAGIRPEIFSSGHRNAQGMDWQPGSGLMFQTEHGPSGFDGPGGGDEVNIVEKGKNYGWPTVMHEDSREGMVDPLLLYTPAVAPASGAFYNSDKLPRFKGNYFFGGLRGNVLMRIELDGRRVVRQERMMTEYGRIREVAMGPDGAIYFSTSNRDGRGRPQPGDDRIMRIRAR